MRSSACFKVLAAAAALLQISCGTLSSRIVADPAPSAARLKNGGSLEREAALLVRPLIEKGELDSAVVGIVTADGRMQSFGYGPARPASGPAAVGGSDLFQVGSVSKVFLAAVLAVLVEEGALRYEDTVGEIMPPDARLSEDLRGVTLHDLVTHTSGLPRQGLGLEPFRHLIRYVFTGRNLYAYLDRDYFYEYLRTCRIDRKDKNKYRYSNIGAALLAHLLEIKTGKSYPELAREKIFDPLNMRDTVFELDDARRPRLAAGHAGHQPLFVRRHTVIEPWDMGAIMNPVGGLYSTADDLLLFARANLGRQGNALEKALERAQTIQLSTPAEDVTRGWVVNYFNEGRTPLHYRHGMASGYSAYLGFNKEKDAAVVVLGGTFTWEDKIGHNLLLRLSQ